MNVGIFYYSRSGNTQKAARLLEEKLKEKGMTTTVVEIQATKKPWYMKAGYAAMREKELPVVNPDFDAKDFDVLLVGGPIWAARPAPYVKTFFQRLKNGNGKKVGLFITSGGPPGSHTTAADMMKKYATSAGTFPIDAFLSLQMMTGQIKDGEQLIDHFLGKVVSK
jgi:flavodoxin